MVIEGALLGVLKAAAGSAAGKLAGMLVEKGKAKIFPGELERAIEAGILAAKAEDATFSPWDHLFFRCYENDRDALLARAIEHPVMLGELRKPLEGEGNIEVACLVKVFEQVAGELKIELVRGSLERWVTTFVEGYREATAASIRFQVAKEQYLEQLARQADDVQFVGIASSGEETKKTLAQIFVMPDVREERKVSERIPMKLDESLMANYLKKGVDAINSGTNSSQIKLLDEQRAWAMRDRSSPKIPAQKVLTQSKDKDKDKVDKNKVVLLGAPGSGKTTLVSYFALMLCEQVGNGPTQIGLEAGQDWLPVVIRIRDWVLKPDLSLLKYLRWYAEESLSVKELPIGFFEHWLERGRALILLDGLDEVVDEAQRRSVVDKIEAFLGQYEDCPAVITSRPAGYRWDFFNLEAFPHYTLEPFDDKQVDTFIDHWYDSRELDKAAAKRRKEDLRSAFKGNDRIRNLATNPLLLTIIALIHRYQAELPRRRFKLYESAVETLLTSWDSGKEMKLSEVLDQKIWKSSDLLFMMRKLAYWIHIQGSVSEVENGTIIDKDELVRQLRKEIQRRHKLEPDHAEAEAEEFVKFIQRRTGLLNEQGKNLYAFVHKTFQEYLTAEEIFKRADYEDDTDIILSHFRDHLHDPHWREVLLLLVSKLEGRKAEKAIYTVLKANSPYEKWLKRDLLFAGWCLTEDPEGLKAVADGLVGEILDGLVSIEVSDRELNCYEVREESTEIIKRLGETTVEGDIWNRLKGEEKLINQFRLLAFQASLGQEGKAIELLLRLFKDDNANVRCRAKELLVKLRNTSSKVLNELLVLLKDNNSSIRFSAASVVVQLESTSFEVVNELFSLLNDNDYDIRYRAASTLCQLGHDSSEVVDELLSLLNNDNSSVVHCAAKSLGQLGNISSEVVNGLFSLLNNDNPIVRFSAEIPLAQLGNSSSEVVNRLLSLLNDDDSKVRSSVASTLGRLGNSSSEVVNGLLSLLNDDDSKVRSSVASTLGRLGNSSAEVVDGLLKLLNDDDSKVRFRAAESLGQLGNDSLEVVNGLLKLLNDDDDNVRHDAAKSLVQLGNSSSEVVNELLKLLNHDDDGICARAAESLGPLRYCSSEVVHGLLKLLNDDDFVIRNHVSKSLVQLGKKSIEVLPALVEWIDRQPDDVPIGDAIDALRSILE